MLSSAPVAFLWTRMSFDLARRVRGCNAPDRAILALLSSCVARLVMHPTALHCTSTLGEFICLINGARPPSATMATLFSAAVVSTRFDGVGCEHTVYGQIAQGGTRCTLHFNVGVLEQEQDRLQGVSVDLSDIYTDAVRWGMQLCYQVVYLALLSRQRSSLRTVVDRCCPSIPEYSARGGVRQRRSRFRLAAHVSMAGSCREGVGSLRSRGSPAGRRQLPSRCQPAPGRICCPSSGLSMSD
jgi:hypothetical protein